MGLDFNSIKFLLWSKNLGVAFDRTLTLGRQGLTCSRGRLGRAFQNFGLSVTDGEVDLCFKREAFTELYADDFLKLLGVKEMVSVDYSDFEGATLLHDLNQPFPGHLLGSFDLVIDGGTLEHIYNYPDALSHCLGLLRVGGHFVAVTPASGQMGHGFYQFSPELFFRFFSMERGFVLRKIVAYDCSKINSPFYEVEDPATTRQRTGLVGKKVIQLAVLAQKTAQAPLTLDPPQQSDYAAIWDEHKKTVAQTDGSPSKVPGLVHRLRTALNPYWPFWLRDLRDDCRHHCNYGYGLFALKSRLTNRRHFRRLANKDIFSERGGPWLTRPTKPWQLTGE
jgi:SAM-dependent methyltransferase